MKKLPITTPPALAEALLLPSQYQYFSICYLYGKASWSCGDCSSTFSYFHLYRPIVEHLAVAIHLEDAFLGDDETPPTHQLLFDRSGSLLLGGDREVKDFLVSHCPQPSSPKLSQEEVEKLINQEINELENLDLESGVRMGMFELFVPPSDALCIHSVAIVRHLDNFITPELIEQYIQKARAGDLKAVLALESFRKRLKSPSD